MKKQSALITGAGRGLGRALATALAARGHSVVLIARRHNDLDEVVRKIRESVGDAHAIATDVAAEGAALAR